MKEEKRYVPLTNDRVFKGFFSNPENKKYLIALMEEYLPIKIGKEDEIEYRNTEMAPKDSNGKLSRMDILIRIKKPRGEFINIEMQVQNQYNMLQRTSFYNSNTYVKQLTKGQDYKDLGNVISLIFVCHQVFDIEEYINNIAYIHEETGQTINEDRRMCFVELEKYRKNKERYKKDIWAELLLAESQNDFETIEREGGLMSEAVKKVQGFSQEYKDSYWDDMYDKAEHDYVTNMRGERETGIKIGETRGIKIGEARGKLLGLSEGKIQGLLLAGVDDEKIMNLIGVNREEIVAVRKKMN